MDNIIPLVSFPKSGNTWMRFLLVNIFKKNKEEEITFKNINEFSPTSIEEDLQPYRGKMIDQGPVFLKVHSNYEAIQKKDFNKVIYIYRNGLDVLESYWHFTDAQSPGLYSNVEQFSKCYWKYCGHWGDHICSWLVNKERTQNLDILAISYEDLKGDTFKVLSRVLVFLGYEIDPALIQSAIESCQSSRMKKMEGSKEFMHAKKEGFHFVRSAKAGTAKAKLPYGSLKDFLKVKNNYEMMKKLNYNIPDALADISMTSGNSIFDYILCKYRFFRLKIIRLW